MPPLFHAPKMQGLTVRRKGTLIIAVSVAFKTVLLLALILVQHESQRADAASEHSKQVLAAAVKLRSELVDAETGMRGYIIGGNPIFLEPYEAAIGNLPITRKRLEDLCRDNPKQLELVSRVQSEIADFLQYHEANRRLIEANQPGPVAQRTRDAEGKRRMDSLRTSIQQLLDIQEKVDAEKRAEFLSSRSRMVSLLYAGLVLNLLVAGLMSLALTRNVANRIQTLTENNRMAAVGKPLGPPMSGHDEITELDAQFRRLWQSKDVETRRALEIYAAELERSNRDLEDFASVASHDLQEPLRKIIAFGGRLEEHLGEGLDARGRDYVQRMRNAADRMSSLNDSLLQLSRVRNKARNLQPVELRSVVSGVIADLEERIRSTGAKVYVRDLPVISADQNQMRQLFQNLLSNALKFKRPDEIPIIEVGCRNLSDGNWEITVQDNGLGFEQRFAEQIFRPFQRLHGRSEFEGNGIGLTIVEKIVARHGGTITAQGQPGKGSRFVITLPENHRDEGENHEDTTAPTHAALAG